ncbi:ZP domain-containing protein-like [Lingula anatina]|uniref:ZP domain-containing protein-like n=1 Tax=Lingula anatina TaxID=7574 RepID=A0A1S3J1T5_LINAN|nr:ZP domain-containing protein-like [Lingula anatina]|eukprot:XP_013404385.1 ZP domain-containing protein-like [Lingula anatina]
MLGSKIYQKACHKGQALIAPEGYKPVSGSDVDYNCTCPWARYRKRCEYYGEYYYWPYDYVDYNCTCPPYKFGKRCEYYGWPTTESPTNESVTPICKAQADIIFILDGSGSVNAPDFAKQLHFIKSLVRKFDVGPNAVKVGVLQYSTYAVQEFNLNTHSTEAAILAAVDRIRQKSGGTNTALALSTARTSSFTAAKGDRPNVPNLVIVMTDGRSNNMAATAREANKLRNIASVFAIGVGSNAYTAELEAMATDPDSKFVFTVTDFSALSNIETELATDACAQATAAPPGKNKRTWIHGTSIKEYFLDKVYFPHLTHKNGTAVSVNLNISVNCDSTNGMTVAVDVNNIQSRLGPMTLTLDDINCVPDQYLGGNETRDTFIYRNALVLRPYSNSLINRELHYRYTVECVLPRYGDVGEEFVAEGTVYGNRAYVANGNFTLRMDLYHSDYFTSPVTSYPHVVRLNQDMYVDVALLTLDVNLKVVLQNCVATPKATKGYPQYALISNKCPDDPTVRFYPSNDTHAQFAVKAFEFFNDPEVYLHCDVIVCNATDRDSRCLRPSEGYACPQNGGRGKRAVPGDVEVYSLVQGPVFVQKENPVAEFAVKDERKNQEDSEEVAQAPASTTLGAGVMAVSACVVVIAAVIVMRKSRSSNADYIPVRTDEI